MTVQPIAFTRDRFTWLAYFMLAWYAYMMSVLAPLMPFLARELGITSYTVQSLHLSAFALGMIGAGLTADRAAGRFGRARLFWLGSAGMVLASLGLVVLRVPALTIASSFLMGLIGTYVLVVVQAALSDHHGTGRSIALTESNVCASISSMLAPLVISQAEGIALGWRVALIIAAAAWGALLLFGHREPIPPQPVHPAHTGNHARLPARFWILWGVVFLAVATEWSVIFWSPDFLTKVVGVDSISASGALTFFFLAAVLGRLAGSRLTRRIAPGRLLIGAALLVVVIFPVYWLSRTPVVAITALFVLGLGIANLFPLTLSAATNAAASNANKASARISLSSGLAILIAPQVLGSLADQIGIQPAFALAGVLAAGVLALAVFAAWMQRRAVPSNSTGPLTLS